MILKDLMLKLNEFRDKTLLIIKAVENEDYNNLNDLLGQRQLIIDGIEQLNYDQKQFKAGCEELDIPVLQSKLEKAIRERHNFVKSELKKVQSRKTVNANYTHSSAVDSIFFNKKI
jgi:hypothetical protein